ncbi:DNA polymerase III beta subunit [Candidatus Syntrophocurvum alkaliphilum]|uniref:Beta sliding clamp n=1 Tax=Candidatus Syntrophocurvum alkaliphilum TaxID=2293317 RepID=A0A6I6DL56_9FIRM|nr:DNA polymerase III subunit beta [Candidatus Syntrophocurvum alkaliphilum]QGU00607.1 DNA polymerase III beta subunit [Candidatus Syntrophocurvum alkaliphilum]
MKFTINKKHLSYLTSLVHRAASNKNTVAALSGLLIEISSNHGLTMTATDMEIGIKASTKEINIIEEGSVLVNAYYFADFIKLLPDTTISIEFNNNSSKLNISYGRSSGVINTYSIQEYPELPLKEMEYKFTLPQNVLKEALKKTVFAATNNHFRQVFTGVLFDIIENNQINIVASDTHRLAFYNYTLENINLEPFNFIIPIRSVNELLRLLDDTDDDIKIGFSENNVIFYNDNFIILSRLIEGKYPNYDQVIPKNFNTKVLLKTDILSNSLERAKTMPTDDKLKIQHAQFTFKEDEISINSFSETIGEIVEIIEEFNLEGDNDIKIAFNTNYLLDVVKLLDNETKEISISLSGSLGPSLIKNPDKNNYLYILVPLRTTG